DDDVRPPAVLILGILLGLLLGLAAGGSVMNLALVRLRWVGALLLAVIVRFATEYLLVRGNPLIDSLRLPLFVAAFGILLAALWVNRTHPGLRLAFVGILLNTVAIVANAGHMPVWLPSLTSAGFSTSDLTPFHVLVGPTLTSDFFLHAGPLADILPIPLPLIRNVASIGDVFLTAGLAFFLFATVVRVHDASAEQTFDDLTGPLAGLAGTTRLSRSLSSAIGGQRVRAGTGLAPSLIETASLTRPLVLGTPGPGLAEPGTVASLRARTIALAPVPAAGAVTFDDGVAIPRRPRVEVGERVRQHPYVRLALNGSFSALWTGQLISLFGDRVHQVALTFLVAGVTNSPLAVAFVFVAATLPNLLLSPIAGTFVDRWNQRDVLIVSDLLRAAAVLVIPIFATANIYLVYPLVFVITSISIFFRPARVAILPRIVRSDELVTANSAMWAGETFADVIGYPLAGIFVAFLGTALPLAFWVDAATYAASAILIASIAIPAIKRRPKTVAATTAKATAPVTEPAEASDSAATEPPQAGVFAEMLEGFRFLRSERVLFANTIQAAFAQFAIGSLTALTPIFVRDVLAPPDVDAKAAYAFLETALGVGNLVGGFAIGLIGARLMKGRLVIAGYVVWGLAMIAFALSGNLVLDFGILLGAGVANMVFVIPSQVLFQERTPQD
ncbi:MAG TPA: MFS transporter, partial [Candidatus Limnocylindrales bacterium]